MTTLRHLGVPALRRAACLNSGMSRDHGNENLGPYGHDAVATLPRNDTWS